jgi:hypothetical protein
VIHAGLLDADSRDETFAILSAAAASGTDIATTGTALTPSGPDLGATHFGLIEAIRPLMITGEGTSEYEVGHTWHHFDKTLGTVPVMVDMHRLKDVRLGDYTHLVMVGGRYSGINTSEKNRITKWINEGGILVSTGSASTWAESLCFSEKAGDCEKDEPEAGTESEATEDRPYAEYRNDEAQQVIGGVIVATSLDTTHPIAYGFARSDLPIFRRGTTVLEASTNAYATAVRYTDKPLMAGFIGPEQQEKIRNQPAVIAQRQGRGLVVRFANNPLFRGFWKGTERLFNNALYMSQAVENTKLPD